MSPPGADTDVMKDRTGIAVFSATVTFCTFTAAGTPDGVGVGVMLGVGSEGVDVTSKPMAPISVRSNGVKTVLLELGELRGSPLRLENRVSSKLTS